MARGKIDEDLGDKQRRDFLVTLPVVLAFPRPTCGPGGQAHIFLEGNAGRVHFVQVTYPASEAHSSSLQVSLTRGVPASMVERHLRSCDGILGESGHAPLLSDFEPIRGAPSPVCLAGAATRHDSCNRAGKTFPVGLRLDCRDINDARLTSQKALPCPVRTHPQRADSAQTCHDNSSHASIAQVESRPDLMARMEAQGLVDRNSGWQQVGFRVRRGSLVGFRWEIGGNQMFKLW